MDNNYDADREIINGANPSIIWTQYMDFLSVYARQMKSQYTKRMRENNPFTWTDLDIMNKNIHDKLDTLMSWNNNVQTESKKIRINEATFKRIIAESVKGVLNEISPELMGAAAMTAAHRAQNTDDPYYKAKYDRQANAFARNAANSYEKENPSMDNVTFNPYDRNIGASFKRNSNGSTLRYDGKNLDGSPHSND